MTGFVISDPNAQARILAEQAQALIDGNWSIPYLDVYNIITTSGFPDPTTGLGSPQPVAGVDPGSWVWIHSAASINSGDGTAVSQFVSAYTQMQAQIRGITPASSVKEASNEVAKNFFNTLIVQNNWAIPDIHQIGLFDGGAAAASYFNGDFAPWSGTPLFTLLGDDSFTKQLLLTTTPFTDPNTKETKLVGGTYDLVSAAELLVNLTTLLVAAQAVFSSDFPTIALIGAAPALEAALATQGFFNTVYGSGVSSISIGNDLFGQISPLIAPTGKYQVGTLAGEDVTLGSSTQVFVGGTGNDNVTLNTVAGDTSTLYPIRVIDGGLGTNTLHDNAPFDLSVTLETLSRSDQTTTYGEAPNWRADITADEPAFNDYAYDFNTIDLGSGNDTVIFGKNVSLSNLTGPDGSPQLQSLDGGSGVNTLDLSRDTENLTLNVKTLTANSGGALQGTITAQSPSAGQPAASLVATNFQTISLGSGHDSVTIDPTVAASAKLTVNAGGENDVFNVGGGTEVLTGGTGNNTFEINQPSGTPTSDIFWGGGGTSTYYINGAPNVYIFYVNNPTVAKIAALTPQIISSTYSWVLPPETFTGDFHQPGVTIKTDSLFIIDPTPNDRIYNNGVLLTDFQKWNASGLLFASGSYTQLNYLGGYQTIPDNYLEFSNPAPIGPAGPDSVQSLPSAPNPNTMQLGVSLLNYQVGDFGITYSGPVYNGPIPPPTATQTVDPTFYDPDPGFLNYSLHNTLSIQSSADAGNQMNSANGSIMSGSGGVSYDIDPSTPTTLISSQEGSQDATVNFLGTESASGLRLSGGAGSDGLGLLLQDPTSGQNVTVLDGLAGAASRISAISFNDGTTLSYAQIIQTLTTGTVSQTRLYGDSDANLIDSHGYANYEQCGGGGDTLIYNTGYGSLEINEVDPGTSPNNVLQFGAGIVASQLTATSTPTGTFMLYDDRPGDQIQIDGQLSSVNDGVQIVTFADGSSMTRAQLNALATTGTSAADTLFGGANADVFDGKGAPAGSADFEVGYGGGDSFIYQRGYGKLEISEGDTATNPANVLQLGSGLTAAQLTVTADQSGDLYIGDGTAGDQIELDSQMDGPANGVQSVSFADGSTLTAMQLLLLATTGTSRADTLFGSSGADVFDGKGAPAGLQDYERGNGGADTFIYNQGYGQLEINESSSAQTVLRLGAGITESTVLLSGDANGNLYVTDGIGGDQIKIDGMLENTTSGVQELAFSDGTVWNTAQPGAGSLALSLLATNGTFDIRNGYRLTATGNGNTISVDGSSNATVIGYNNTISAAAAAATATGTFEADGDGNTLQGGAGADTLTLNGDGNLFVGGAGNASATVTGNGNVLVGGAGQMTFIAKSGSGNLYAAGSGYVTLDYSQDSEAVSVDLTAGTASFAHSTGVDQLYYIPEVHVGSDSAILAGALPVTLVANGNDSTLTGGSGYDTLTALGNGNTLQAGAGGANLTATGNTNLLEGGTTFFAVLSASGDHNTLQGGSGTNTLIVSGDSNLLTSGGGYEEVDVTGNDNSLDAYDSNVSVSLSGNGNLFTGGSNYASVFVEGNDNFVTGGSQYTNITAYSGSGNTYSAGAGYASLDYSGDTEPVSVNLATGTASFVGSSGIDRIEGITQLTIQSNSSILAGSSGTNLVINGDGSTLHGGGGFDVLTSNGDDDTLIAGSGGGNLTANGSSNLLEGGSAYAVLTAYGDQNTFQGGIGTNTLVSYGEHNVLTGGGGYEDITLYGDDDTLHTQASNTALTVNGDGNQITGGSNYTSVSVSGSGNVLTGGSAAIDFKSFGGSGNSFNGGTGQASLDYSGNPLAASVNLAAGTASFAGSSSVDTISNISVVAVGSNSSLVGDSGSDSLYIFGSGSTLKGGSGNDMLTAYGQNDTLTAGTGGGILSANGTNDVYSNNPVNASVTIQNNPGTDGAANQLNFLSGASTEQLWLTKSGNDLQIQTVGSRYTTTVQGWFSSSSNQLQEINSSDGWHLDTGISQLVQAMATYESSHTGFNHATATIMPTDSTLQGAITAAWHH